MLRVSPCEDIEVAPWCAGTSTEGNPVQVCNPVPPFTPVKLAMMWNADEET